MPGAVTEREFDESAWPSLYCFVRTARDRTGQRTVGQELGEGRHRGKISVCLDCESPGSKQDNLRRSHSGVVQAQRLVRRKLLV